jgi:hypothetical protein
VERLARATVLVAVALWSLVGTAATPAETAAASVSTPAPDAGAEVVFRALSLLGVNYRFGGNTVDSGLDCSGLVRLVFHETLGLPLPRRSEEISRVGGAIPAHDLQPGDLVFFNTLRRAFSHVGIYIGNNQFVHAPSSGGSIRVESMGSDYWTRRFDGARRLLTADLLASARATGALAGDRLALSLPALRGSVLADAGAPRDLLAALQSIAPAPRPADPPFGAPTAGGSAPTLALSSGTAGGGAATDPVPPVEPAPAAASTTARRGGPTEATNRPAAADRPAGASRSTARPASAARPTARRASPPVTVAAKSAPSRHAAGRSRASDLYVN